MSQQQDTLLVYTAIALGFGQRPLPAGALRTILGMSSRDRFDMYMLLPEAAIDLLVEELPGEWRVGHSLVAEEILRQIMSRGADPRTWENHLANWGNRLHQVLQRRTSHSQ